MYTSRTGLVLGFHGTDQSIVTSVLNGERDLKASENSYDWLGNGIYFWDNSPSRALEWAETLSKRPKSKIKKPAVIGAIIDLGYCLDLLDYQNISLLIEGYSILQTTFNTSKSNFPLNRGNSEDLLHRELGCAVIETLHQSIQNRTAKSFDSVRGVFWEGKNIYDTAGFREKNHIQICVRNRDCIKGYFLPLSRIMN